MSGLIGNVKSRSGVITGNIGIADSLGGEIRLTDTNDKPAGYTIRANGTRLQIGENGVADRIALIAGGNVGIGIMAPGAALDIRSDSSTSKPLNIYDTASDADGDTTMINLNFSGDSSPNQARYFSFQRAGLGQIGSISCNGNSNVFYNTSSDMRLKENVTEISDGLSKVLQMHPVDYTWIDGGDKGNGFLAQELFKIYPFAVSEGGELGLADVEKNKPWAIDYGRLTPVLTKAIQELSAKNDALEKRILALENA